MDPKVERLQNHLALIRTSAGWSTTELGEKLGVSRQMISNIESGRNKMTMMQYRAIRHALNEEIASSNENDTKMLEDVILVLVDEPDSFTDEQRTQVLSDANLLAPSIVSKKTTRKKASTAWVGALAGAVIAVAVVGAKALLNKKTRAFK